MKRFRARDDDEKGEFGVDALRQLDAETRRFIAKAVVLGGMSALLLAVVVLAMRGDGVRLMAAVGVISNLLSFLLGRYFDKGKDG